MKARPVVVVLAAGKGSRFAGPMHKLGQRLGETSVLGETLNRVLASHLPIVVVTTDDLAAEATRWVAARDLVIVPSVGSTTALPLGMGYSIAAGVTARPNAPAWLVLPGDMPLVQPATLRTIAQAIEHHSVVYAQHRGRRGHPVAFAAELYSELSALDGDAGARRLVARYPAVGIEVPDAGVLVDIDTEADLLIARASHQAEPIDPALNPAPDAS